METQAQVLAMTNSEGLESGFPIYNVSALTTGLLAILEARGGVAGVLFWLEIQSWTWENLFTEVFQNWSVPMKSFGFGDYAFLTKISQPAFIIDHHGHIRVWQDGAVS